MPRIARHAPRGIVYHVLNRANGRLRLFKKEEDLLAFEEVLSFPIQEDGHLLTVLRYVERNLLRANLVEAAEDWRWGSCIACWFIDTDYNGESFFPGIRV